MLTEILYLKPIPSDYFKDIYSELRGLKKDFRERFELDHYMGESTDPADYNCDGYHKHLTFAPSTADPEGDAIYFKPVGSASIPFLKRGEDNNPLIPVAIYGDDLEFKNIFDFSIGNTGIEEQNCIVYASSDLGAGEQGACWGTSPTPTKGEKEMFLNNKTIYMRGYKVKPDNSIVYSTNTLKMEVGKSSSMYYIPSSTTFSSWGQTGYFLRVYDYGGVVNYRIYYLTFYSSYYEETEWVTVDISWYSDSSTSSGKSLLNVSSLYRTSSSVHSSLTSTWYGLRFKFRYIKKTQFQYI